MEARKQLEAEFHNARQIDRLSMDRESFEKKYSNQKFYSITRRTKSMLREWMRKCEGHSVLDYCCGTGVTSVELAEAGANVVGIDIAADEVAAAQARAVEAGVSARTQFVVMDAENLTFPDRSFDFIVCNGVLHHLDLERAYPELSRVLKPGGQIICLEALGYNPIIQLYRTLTPKLRTAWEAKHILTIKQVAQARRYFAKTDVRFYYLFSILAVPFRKTPFFTSFLSAMEMLDSLALKIPGVQLMAWQMVFTLEQPRDAAPRNENLAHQGR